MMLFLDAVFKFFLNSLICLLIFNIIASYVIEITENMNNDDEEEEDDYKNNHWKNKY